ncbi:MAG: hypothetical protein H6838_10735 [Planctomycetes bacterium]|nr:hypothetical protein [Planctomycetota bacterium]MCB9885962.1 hypothetical protein [Planctomycetota bacterium]
MSAPLACFTVDSTHRERVVATLRAQRLPVLRTARAVGTVVGPVLVFGLLYLLLWAAFSVAFPDRSIALLAALPVLVVAAFGDWRRFEVISRRGRRLRAMRRLERIYGTGPVPFRVELHPDFLLFVAGRQQGRVPWSKVREVRCDGHDLTICSDRHLGMVAERGFATRAEAEAFHALVERLVVAAGRGDALRPVGEDQPREAARGDGGCSFARRWQRLAATLVSAGCTAVLLHTLLADPRFARPAIHTVMITWSASALVAVIVWYRFGSHRIRARA